MNRIGIIAACVAAALTMIGCASANDWTRLSAAESIAIVQVSANRVVETEAEGRGADVMAGVRTVGALVRGGSVGDAMEAATHSSGNAIDASVDSLFRNVREAGTFTLLSPSQVTGSEFYRELGELASSGEYNTAEGFRFVAAGGRFSAAEALMGALDVDALMVVFIDYNAVMWTGIQSSGTMKAYVEATAYVYDESGVPFVTVEGSANSEDTVVVAAGAYDFDAMDELAAQAINRASLELAERIRSEVAENREG